MLRLQCDHAIYLLDSLPEIVRKIIEGLCMSLMAHVNVAKKQNLMKEYKDVSLTFDSFDYLLTMYLFRWC